MSRKLALLMSLKINAHAMPHTAFQQQVFRTDRPGRCRCAKAIESSLSPSCREGRLLLKGQAQAQPGFSLRTESHAGTSVYCRIRFVNAFPYTVIQLHVRL